MMKKLTVFNAGYVGYWWSATEYVCGLAGNRNMRYNSEYVSENGSLFKSVGVSARCLQD